MPLNLSPPPDLPDLNSPGTYNQRVLDSFTYVFQTLVSELTALTPEDFFQVMSSLTDATPGKLLTVGAFGWGATGAVDEIADIDATDTPSGAWIFTSTTVNKESLPAAFADAFGVIIVHRSISNLLTQTAWRNNGDAGVYRRHYSGGNWLPWVRVFDQSNILGTVSQSGGVPTGALIERGSNANGHYARFADGTQICHDRRSVSYATAQAMTATWIYPAPFSANPQVSIAIDEDNLTNNATPSIYEVLSYFDSIGTSSVRLALGRISGMTSFSSGDTAGVDALAIGRWF
jgi:hypothetical protein